MSNTKQTHTPGPWVASGSEVLAAEFVVAQVNPDMLNSRWMRDAALVAAAPELLSALEFLLSDPLESVTPGGRKRALEAIRKATGGAS